MTVRESLQTLATLKEQEASSTSEKEKALQEFEELKKDIFLLVEEEVTDWLNTGINDLQNAFIYYYTYEPEIIEGVFNKLLTRFTIEEEISNTLYRDKNGQMKHRKQLVGKYSKYNQNALRDLIPKLFIEYLKLAKAHEEEYIKLLKEKETSEKQKQQKKAENDFYFYIECFKKIYNKQNISINNFIANINTAEFKKIFFEELGLDLLDYDTLKNYKKAVKEFTKEYQEPTRDEKEKKTVAGLSVGAFTLAGVIGLFEAFGKK